MRTHRLKPVQGALLALCLVLPGLGFAHNGVDHANQAEADVHAGVAPVEAAQVELKSFDVVDQNRERRDFAREAVGDHIVAITTVYTQCTTVCPISTVVFGQVQERLGARLDNPVRLLAVSVDPNVDTPKRLRKYAAERGAKPGWYFLTGNRLQVDSVLEGLGLYTTNFKEHAPTVIVGDGQSGEWYRFNGMPDPDRIIAQVDYLLDKRAARAAQAAQKE